MLLIPGYGGSHEALLVLARRIVATGRDARVLTLAGDGTGDLSAQVDVLATAVEQARAPTVDVIGYSAGGVVAGLYAARHPDAATRIRRVITLGAPLAGTRLAAQTAAQNPQLCPPGCRQLVPGSAELGELAAADVGDALPWLSVWTVDDLTVTPPDSSRLTGAPNVAVQQFCPCARLRPAPPAITASACGSVSC